MTTDSDTQDTITLSVFISSPGDLASTRNRAKDVINQISGSIIEGKKVIFKPMLYEDHAPAMIGYSPQQAVDYFMGCAEEMNIYVGMFWARMGSPVIIKGRKHDSGTRYEFDSAYKGFRMTGRPLMLLYRCNEAPSENSTLESQASVASFFDRFKGLHPQYEGFPQSFVSDDDFAAMLVRDLDQYARHIIHGTFAAKELEHGHELAELVTSVRKWLATFEDMFGKDMKEDQERERDRLFPTHFRALSDKTAPSPTVSSEVLPGKDESLLDLFDSWGKRMLMVGERGTGKTFAMLRLMQDLADRAFIRRGDPVPVFFNLSSWSETYHESARPPTMLVRAIRWIFPKPKRGASTLDQWLEDQMVRNYSMQRKAAKRLLGTNSVIICLDGLDELGAGMVGDAEAVDKASRELRDACVNAINGSLANHSVRMILCCREETYHELSVKPLTGIPLQTQLLTSEEVLDDLQFWDRLEGFKLAITQSPALQERARVALFLGMMRTAYQDMDAQRILNAVELPKLEWEKHLMDHYVDQCMRLAPPESRELNKTLIPDCLSWIAQQPDNDFLLDDLQPSVLRADGTPEGVSLWKQYRRLSVVLLAALLAIIESFAPGLSLGVEHGFATGAKHGVGMGLWSAITHCVTMWGISLVILFPLYLGAFSANGWIRFGFFFGLAWCLDSATVVYLSVPQGVDEFSQGSDKLSGTWEGAIELLKPTMPIAWMFFMLLGMHFFERLSEHRRRYSSRPGIEWHEILAIEPLSWRWFDEKSHLRGGWIGLLVGPLVIIIALMCGQSMRGLVAAPLITLLVCTFSGLCGSGIARVSIEPNQGIARSLRHAIFMLILFVTTACITFGLIYGMSRGWIQGLVGAIMGLSLGFSFFVFGGIPVVRQLCLGTILHKEGKLPTWCCWPPWKATIEFLDDLVRYKLLRRSAGGYMFRHQSLRDYYRSLVEQPLHPQMATDPSAASTSSP